MGNEEANQPLTLGIFMSMMNKQKEELSSIRNEIQTSANDIIQ